MIDETSAILDAHLLRKPVISVAVKAEEFGLPTVLRNDSCALTDLLSFEKIFYQMINDDGFRNKIIKNANTSIQKHMSFHYDGATTLLTFLEKFENKF